jgi:hypothetical protein
MARAEALTGLGTVLRRAGRDDEAAAVVAAAVAVYVRKGDVVSAARWREDERLEGGNAEVRDSAAPR